MVSDEPTIPAPLDIDVPPPALDAPEVAPVAAEPAPVDEPTPEDEQAQDEQAEPEAEGEEEPPAPVRPTFGLLFQAPEPVVPRRRRPAPEPEAADDDPEDEQGAVGDDSEGGGTTRDRMDDDTESTGGGRRRRRRGGRGRKNRAENAGTEDDDSDEAQDAKGASGGRSRTDDAEGDGSGEKDQDEDSTDDGEGDSDGSGSGSSRRRRRRRRGGSGGSEQDDPPGTVTKVREGRKERDEPTAVKGSTRLEAKKQRRREGREAGRRRTIITEAEFLARRESVERVMVVRAKEGRTQIGVLEDDVLVEHYVSRETSSSMVGNVYLGRVQNVLPSMEAAFVDIGKGRNAVLYAGEVNWDAAGLENGQAKRIENALSAGDPVVVQVTKDPIGHKGARLTSQVSLPGRYLVYVPEGNMTGISRKLPDTERARLKAILKEVVPSGAGVIVRTAAEGASEEELRRDVERLTKAWERVQQQVESKKGKKASAGGAPALLNAEPDMTVRVIRDIFNEDFSTLVVSGDAAWDEVSGYLQDVAPDLASRAEKWTGTEDVFTAHRIDEQIAKAMDRKVWLKSGGSLVIDRTEAMTVIDVNTGKFTGSGGNLEQTVTENNIEAAEEIVRQLRLRDIGGIIVIDFIDMVLEANRDLVVRRLLECLGRDRTKHQVAEVTSLGLVQMTRKRVGSGLIEVFGETCESCNGRGIHVHSEPIDRSDSNGGGARGGKNGTHDGGNDGGGKRKKKGDSGKAKADKEPPRPAGPTMAAIAAGLHAAAVKSATGEAPEDDVAELAAAEAQSDRGPVDLDTSREEEAPAAAEDTGEVDSSPVPEPEPQPRRRKKRARVVAGAGAPGAVQVQHVETETTTPETAATDPGPSSSSPADEPQD